MSRATAIVADDEQALLSYLSTALAAQWPELEIIGKASNGPEALELFEAHRPDVAFLDIQMPGMTGLEVARRIAGRCHVVFITAYEQYAVQAFEAAAVDYLLKPVQEERLAETVARLRSRLSSAPRDMTAMLDALSARLRPASYLEFIQVQHRQDVMLVPVEEVLMFQSSEKYTLAITLAEEWVIRTPLKQLESLLDPARFWRVHRNSIVRVGAIARVTRDADGQALIELRDSSRTAAVSRAYAHRFRQM